jgi:hypothetical protein
VVRDTSLSKECMKKFQVTSTLNKRVTLLEAVYEIYIATLDAKNFQKLNTAKELKELVEDLYRAFGYDPTEYITYNKELIGSKLKRDKALNIYLFTGGKDSLASYLKYRKDTKRRGLIYFKGLNPMYTQEDITFKEIEKIIKDKVEVVEFKAPRVKNQVESSVKNLLSYILAIEYYQVIPNKISFGYVSGEELDLSFEDEELQALLDLLEAESALDKDNEEGSLQTSEVYGDSKRSAINNILVLEKYYKGISFTEGVETLRATFEIIRKTNKELQHYLSSCMSLPQHKKFNKDTLNKKYGLEIEGDFIIGGTVKKEPLHRYYKKHKGKVQLKQIKNLDKVGLYECGVCFKCVERYIMNYLYFNVEYQPRFINSRYRLLVKNILKFNNSNSVDMEEWFRELGLDNKLIDKLRYYNYITKREELQIKELINTQKQA